MFDLQNRKLVQLASIAALVMLTYQGYQIRNGYIEKADSQQTVVEKLQQFAQQFQALKESRGKWDKQYPRVDSIAGLPGLIEYVKFDSYGLQVDPDKITIASNNEITQGMQGNVPLGLVKICLATPSGEKGVLEVSAPSYQALMTGIDKLSHRPDITIGNISVKKGDGKNPVGRLGDFCVQLRSE